MLNCGDKSIHVIYENVLRFLFIPSSFKIKPLGVGSLKRCVYCPVGELANFLSKIMEEVEYPK